MSELLYRARLRGARELNTVIRRPFKALLDPFEASAPHPTLIHRCYHKVGTVWFGRILRHVAAEFGLSFLSANHLKDIKDVEAGRLQREVLLDLGSHINLSKLSAYRGSHMIRDPRDLVISAYFYHKWTDEKWANVPKEEYGGLSYKAHLNQLPKEEGLTLEIVKSHFWIQHMASWPFSDPDIMEIKYEDLLLDEDRIFLSLFKHYGFREKAAAKACKIAKMYSFDNFKKKQRKGAKSHLRSGQAQEWRDHFSKSHIAQFKKLYPGAAVKLGYETDDSW